MDKALFCKITRMSLLVNAQRCCSHKQWRLPLRDHWLGSTKIPVNYVMSVSCLHSPTWGVQLNKIFWLLRDRREGIITPNVFLLLKTQDLNDSIQLLSHSTNKWKRRQGLEHFILFLLFLIKLLTSTHSDLVHAHTIIIIILILCSHTELYW